MTSTSVGTVVIKTTCTQFLKDNFDRISVLYSAQLREKSAKGRESEGITSYDVFLAVPGTQDRKPSPDFVTRLQKYIDDICREGCVGAVAGEDSSYDSDYDVEPFGIHHDVSRTTSDTLAAEYSDYVQTLPENTPGYTARVEFALKLGYTERLVQAALSKLGPSPTQNELLAELIKLGAQRGNSSCDNSPVDGHLELPADFQEPTSTSQILRAIVIDGSNVAMSHGNKELFSCRGIKIAVDWFKLRGHKDITVFVPKWRKEAPRPDNPVRDQEILAELEKERMLVFTPSRLIGGKRLVCYDDRYILKLAAEIDGIVVSNDNYRDLAQENADFRKVVEERILMYSFVNDRFMPPDDPLGRSGPTLDNFLRFQPKKIEPPPPCPYAKKCTYGNKCKYHHPERGPFPHKSVTERLSEHAQRHLQAREGGETRKTPLGRTRSGIPPPNEPPHSIVSKSRSVDNVGGVFYPPPPPTSAAVNNENLHKKLQRQLTLNPGSDPRLAGARFLPQPMRTFVPNPSWELHQHVTRIASAPDSYHVWPTGAAPTQHTIHTVTHMQRMSSCSDPQLNLWPQHWQINPAVSMQEDARRKLYFHLSAIFPEEQVVQAMHLYPDETNAQKICGAILSMNPAN